MPIATARPGRVGLGGRRIAGIVAAALLLIVVAGGGASYVAGGSKSAATVAQPSAASLPLTEPAKPLPHLSIVVLPFANLSGDATQDYFADGITESLTTDLSRISGAEFGSNLSRHLQSDGPIARTRASAGRSGA